MFSYTILKWKKEGEQEERGGVGDGRGRKKERVEKETETTADRTAEEKWRGRTARGGGGRDTGGREPLVSGD